MNQAQRNESDMLMKTNFEILEVLWPWTWVCAAKTASRYVVCVVVPW